MDEFKDERSKEEREAFAALDRKKIPPHFLEERIVHALKEANLIRPRVTWRTSAIKIGSAVAASVALLIIGLTFGVWWKSIPATNQKLPEFMLVLQASPQESPNRSAEDVLRSVREYSAWAATIRKQGVLVDGEKLTNDGRILTMIDGRPVVYDAPNDPKKGRIAGYFLIHALDYQQAETIAKDCPHLKTGGTIELRQIDSIK
jgi:hypothetical protein